MVVKRKLIPAYAGIGNRPDLGASNQAVVMSVVETGVLNGVQPLDVFRKLRAGGSDPGSRTNP
jgi:hypothetical protein